MTDTATRSPRAARLTVRDGEADFQRALGRVVVSGVRLEALAPGGTPIVEEKVRDAWLRRAAELLGRRDAIVEGLARDTSAASMLRMRAQDGSIIAVDAHELETLAARMIRHRAAGLALGFAAQAPASVAEEPAPVREPVPIGGALAATAGIGQVASA